MALTNKIEAFKKHFNIESEIEDVEFCLDKENNPIAKFPGSEYVLNNLRNKNKFLSYDTLRYTEKMELNLYARLNLKDLNKKVLEVKKYTQKEMMIALFKFANSIDDEDSVIDTLIFEIDNRDRMYMIWKNEKDYLFVGGRPNTLRCDYDLMRYLGVDFSSVLNTKFKHAFVEDYYVKGKNPYREQGNNEEFQPRYSTNNFQFDYDVSDFEMSIKPPSQAIPFLEFNNFKRINISNKFGVKDCLNENIKEKFQLFYLSKKN